MVASALTPLAVFAVQDEGRATPIVHSLGSVPSVAVPTGELIRQVQSIDSLRTQIDASDPIILLVSAASASSPLFQSIALYTQSESKRLIVIDLDDAGTTNVVGNIKHYSDTVICSSDPELPDVLEAPDRWTLPDGKPYPETGIKYQSKC